MRSSHLIFNTNHTVDPLSQNHPQNFGNDQLYNFGAFHKDFLAWSKSVDVQCTMNSISLYFSLKCLPPAMRWFRDPPSGTFSLHHGIHLSMCQSTSSDHWPGYCQWLGTTPEKVLLEFISWSKFIKIKAGLEPNINKLRPAQNGWHVADNIFKCIYLNNFLQCWLKFHWNMLSRI